MNIFTTMLFPIIAIANASAFESTYANCQLSETPLRGYITNYNENTIILTASNDTLTEHKISRHRIHSIMQQFLIHRMNQEEIQVCITDKQYH